MYFPLLWSNLGNDNSWWVRIPWRVDSLTLAKGSRDHLLLNHNLNPNHFHKTTPYMKNCNKNTQLDIRISTPQVLIYKEKWHCAHCLLVDTSKKTLKRIIRTTRPLHQGPLCQVSADINPSFVFRETRGECFSRKTSKNIQKVETQGFSRHLFSFANIGKTV